ncbi:MAG: hypothetical protein KDC46_09885 [Thermoleophilia bacterium]|nr:hypothetical protein [Thermoleophilia bacterium]
MSRRDPPRLPRRIFNAFRYGNKRRFDWNLNAEMAWAVSMAAFHEVPVEEVLRLLAHPANAAGAGRWWQHKVAKYGEGCRHRLEREVRRTYEKFAAQRREAIRDRSEAKRVIGEMRDVAAAQVWPGHSGAADRRVLIAHMTLAIQAGSVRYGASARQVAETGNVSVKTAIAATRRLIALGALAQLAPGRVSCESARYRLPEGDKVATTVLPFEVGMVVEGMSLWELRLHPLFQHGSGFDSDVYAALDQDPRSQAELAARIGKSKRQVERVLNLLSEIRAAIRSDDGWCRAGGRPELDAAAEDRGLTERLRARSDQMHRESQMHRAGYQEYLARRARSQQAQRRVSG